VIVELARDGEERRRLGEAGRREVEDEFTIEAMAARAERLYERVIEERR
jgi:glycosyltransferase involved in cell wall biosynthesis